MANGVTKGLLECAVLSGGAETPVLLSDIEAGVSEWHCVTNVLLHTGVKMLAALRVGWVFT